MGPIALEDAAPDLMVDAGARIRSRLTVTHDERADSVVCLLLDQSGSMRGQKMLFAAASTDIAQEFLITLGFTCEVLGFTTSRWRGGRSRRADGSDASGRAIPDG